MVRVRRPAAAAARVAGGLASPRRAAPGGCRRFPGRGKGGALAPLACDAEGALDLAGGSVASMTTRRGDALPRPPSPSGVAPPSLRRAGVWGSAPAGAGGARRNRPVAALPPPLRGLPGLPGALAGSPAARVWGGRVHLAGVEGLLVLGRRAPADPPGQTPPVGTAD